MRPSDADLIAALRANQVTATQAAEAADRIEQLATVASKVFNLAREQSLQVSLGCMVQTLLGTEIK